MKKYLSIFTLLVLAFVLCTNTSVYAANKSKKSSSKQKISVYYENDVKSKYKDYKIYKLKSGEPAYRVFFVPNKKVKNFKILALTFVSMDKNSNITYDTKMLYSTKTLTPKKPLLADIEYLSEGIPNLGISYVDSSGKIQKYIVYESGKDGSIQLGKEDF